MEETQKNRKIFISSIDLLRRIGLSRATLNNYIKAGILPHPVVRKPNDTIKSKAKRIGYFPDSVLGTLDLIKHYKKEGHSMNQIQQILAHKTVGLSEDSEIKNTWTASAKIHSPDPGSESGELFYLEGDRLGNTATDTTIPDDTVSTSERVSVVQDLFKRSMPIPLSFSVLAADLHDPIRICAEMNPDEYLKLINKIWICVKSSLRKYFGTYGKHAGNEVVYYFLKNRYSNYLMNPILCALELREKMRKLSDEWKQNTEWYEDLYLNIGINEGYEFFGKISTAPTVEFIALGDTTNYALRLSNFARCGSIWTTKNLLTRLDEKERKKIRYGIRRGLLTSDVAIEKAFSRIADLISHDTDTYPIFRDISTLTVTEIHNLF